MLTGRCCHKRFIIAKDFYGETYVTKLKNNTKVNILIFSGNASQTAPKSSRKSRRLMLFILLLKYVRLLVSKGKLLHIITAKRISPIERIFFKAKIITEMRK